MPSLWTDRPKMKTNIHNQLSIKEACFVRLFWTACFILEAACQGAVTEDGRRRLLLTSESDGGDIFLKVMWCPHYTGNKKGIIVLFPMRSLLFQSMEIRQKNSRNKTNAMNHLEIFLTICFSSRDSNCHTQDLSRVSYFNLTVWQTLHDAGHDATNISVCYNTSPFDILNFSGSSPF